MRKMSSNTTQSVCSSQRHGLPTPAIGAEDRLRPVHAAQEMVRRHDHAGGDEHAPVAVKRQERQRAEDVEMHLQASAREVDEQRGGKHLPGGDGVAGEVEPGLRKIRKKRHGGENPAQADGGGQFDLEAAGAPDPDRCAANTTRPWRSRRAIGARAARRTCGPCGATEALRAAQ